MTRRDDLYRMARKLARSPANDAVKLAYLTGEERKALDKLDLSAVTEFKRTKDGGVELKFLDRMAAIKWLIENFGDAPEAKRLYAALERSAERSGERREEER